MEEAAAAIEKVPLLAGTSADGTDPGSDPTTASENGIRTSPAPNWLDKLLTRLNVNFGDFCHALCGYFLRFLSTAMLLVGILAAVILQILAYYYTGVLNPYVLIACVLYMPSLAGVSILREETLASGTSRSGTAPYRTRLVTLAYLMMGVSGFASLCQPLVMRGGGRISVRSMWSSIGATLFLYYCIVVSEVLFAAAINVRRSKEVDEERRRAELQDPAWFQHYQSTLSRNGNSGSAV